MSEDTKKKGVYDSFFRPVLKLFLQSCLFVLLIGFVSFLFFYFFKGPIKEFVNTFSWYVSANSVSDMTAKETKALAHLMSKNYILSTNDLLSQIGSFYSYTITILIFFCTFSAFFAVLVIKINADDKFDITIAEKVRYFFANDKGFDSDVKSKVSDIFAEEGEQLSGIDKNEDNDTIIQLRHEIKLLKMDFYKLKNKLAPDDESEVNTDDYFKNMIDTLQDKGQIVISEKEDVDHGNP
ncbi:hypothetical protein HV357_01270 [Enterobacter cloacae]|uniref:hypothetical protein n=1 Tax=Enterobacter cloacae TaxID=550 RepID=UPI0015FA9C19|nr:hypothetical protein [Enterobacter cloacae]MBA7849146.1 hypothetical protein [Enterobacter cloacae]HCT2636147.1 hypothetical protein [Enterobacter roggenkampii]